MVKQRQIQVMKKEKKFHVYKSMTIDFDLVKKLEAGARERGMSFNALWNRCLMLGIEEYEAGRLKIK